MRGRREEELVSYPLPENGLGATIRAWRRFRGMTVTELAVQAGFGKEGRGYISKIEHQQIKRLGEERLQRIAAALQLQSVDLLLHRMPETHGGTPASGLDDAIIAGKALLHQCKEQLLDWARIQLVLAKLYYERATMAQVNAAKYSALHEAKQCVERSLRIFNAETAPQSFQEATHLSHAITELMEASIILCSRALLQRYVPQSLDWARIHLQLAKFHHARGAVLPTATAKVAFSEAKQCVAAALPIFMQKQVQRSLKEARQLDQEITDAMKQLEELSLSSHTIVGWFNSFNRR